MKLVLGLFLLVLGVAFGLYVGIYLMLVGGISQIIEALKATEVLAFPIAIGAVKICFAGIVGFLAGLVAIIPGATMLKNYFTKERKWIRF